MFKLDIEIPTLDDMDKMSLNELKEWKEKLGVYYVKRFEMDIEDYLKIHQYISFAMMIENIENGIDRWHRIDGKRVTSSTQQKKELKNGKITRV
jgi:hypothetical protein